MDDDLDITPVGESTPKVRVYRDSVDVIPREQPHEVQRQATQVSNPSASDTSGINPADIVIQGDWVGSDASTLADRLESILDDDDVDRVDVSGANNTTRYDGEYRLAERVSNTEEAPQTDLVFSYEIGLIED